MHLPTQRQNLIKKYPLSNPPTQGEIVIHSPVVGNQMGKNIKCNKQKV